MSKEIDLDLHGYTVIQAVRSVEDLLASYDMRKDTLKIVTGNGEIRLAIMDYLDKHGYEWTVDGVNVGCIIVFT